MNNFYDFLFTSFRFEEIFCDRETVRGVQKQLEVVIEEGVEKLGVLLSQKMDDKHSKVKKMTKIQKSKIKRKWGIALYKQKRKSTENEWIMYNVHGRNCAIMQELLSKHMNFISICVGNVVGTENDIN